MNRFTTHNGKIVGFKGDMDKLAKAMRRLSEYEDTGLLPEDVAALQKKVERQEADVDFLLKRISDLLNNRNTKEMIALRGDNVLLKVEVEKAKEENKRLQDKITAAADLLLETRREDTSEPDTPRPKQKVAWEAN